MMGSVLKSLLFYRPAGGLVQQLIDEACLPVRQVRILWLFCHKTALSINTKGSTCLY